MAAEAYAAMTSKRVILSLWLGGLSLLWACQPLLVSQARGIVVLALFTGVLAGLGGLTGLRVLVVWSGGVGIVNLTLALLLTASPPHLWMGLSAGLTLLLLARIHRLASEQQRVLRVGVLTIGQVLLLSLAETNPFFLATIPVQTLLVRHEWRKWELKRLQERLDRSDRIVTQAAVLLERATSDAFNEGRPVKSIQVK